jgi:hypothetical protein
MTSMRLSTSLDQFASVSSASAQPLLDLDGSGKQQVVLQVYVPMQVALETLQFDHADRVGAPQIIRYFRIAFADENTNISNRD